MDEILEITKELEVSAAGKIKNSIANLKLIMQIKNKLQKIIVSKKYKDSIREFIKTFEKVSDLQDQYFKNYIGSKKAQLPEEKLKLIREYSINSTIASLTESGLNVNILDKVEDIIRQNTTTGGSYSSLQGQLRDFILSDKNTDGALVRYTKTITTDAINQYSRQYVETTAADLDMPWRKYIGSLKTTSREWCEKMVAKKFVHVSELPELVKGNIDGHQCGIYKKTADNKGTDLPYGMIAGTNAQNVLVRAGGHGCEHGFYPCDEDEVPKDVIDRFKNKETNPNEINVDEGKIKDLDKNANTKLYSNLSGPLLPALKAIVDRSRKILTDREKKQLISNNGLSEKLKIDKSSLYSTNSQEILKHELETIKKLLQSGHDVLFMPDSYFKKDALKFDAIIFKGNSYFKADLKSISSQNSDTIANAISHGASQAGNIIVDVMNNVEYKILIDGIVSAAQSNNQLKSIIIFYKGRKKSYSVDAILSKKFTDSIHKDFIKN